MKISGLVKFSTLDYPGNISAVIFSPGCNYDCYYCHNRELIGGSPGLIPNTEVRTFLENRAGLIDAVVFSGGEAALQEDLLDWAGYCQGLGYLVKIDTNGSRPDVIRAAVDKGCVDYVSVDYKAPYSRYFDVCSGDANAVKQTFGLLLESDISWEARTTVIPQLNEDDLLIMAREAPVFPLYALQTYRPPESYKPEHSLLVRQKPHPPQWIESVAQGLKAHQPNIIFRG